MDYIAAADGRPLLTIGDFGHLALVQKHREARFSILNMLRQIRWATYAVPILRTMLTDYDMNLANLVFDGKEVPIDGLTQISIANGPAYCTTPNIIGAPMANSGNGKITVVMYSCDTIKKRREAMADAFKGRKSSHAEYRDVEQVKIIGRSIPSQLDGEYLGLISGEQNFGIQGSIRFLVSDTGSEKNGDEAFWPRTFNRLLGYNPDSS